MINMATRPKPNGTKGLITGLPIEFSTEGGMIGRGGFGTVYKYETPNGLIALKFSNKLNNGVNKELLREAVALSTLNHPNVIRLLDVYISNGEMGIILPLAELSLDQYVLNRRLTDDLVRIIGIQVIYGLIYIHSKDLIHGDIKSGNILIYREKECNIRAVISDFGTAKTNKCFHVDRQIGGTLSYLPPEVALGDTYSTEGDIWALACTFKEMLTYRRPFDIKKGSNVKDVLIEQFRVLETPTEVIWPGVTVKPKWLKEYLDNPEPGLLLDDIYYKNVNGEKIPLDIETQLFLQRLFVYNPKSRINLLLLLEDPWLRDISSESLDIMKGCDTDIPVRIDCRTSLMARKAKGDLTSPNDIGYKIRLYRRVMNLITAYKSSDRVRGLSIYIFERSIHLTDDEDIEESEILEYFVSSYLIASTLLDNKSAKSEDISKNVKSNSEILDLNVRVILYDIGINLYIATSYDILVMLCERYTQLVRDISLSLLQLSYYTDASLRGPYNVAISCIFLSCIAIQTEMFDDIRDVKGK